MPETYAELKCVIRDLEYARKYKAPRNGVLTTEDFFREVYDLGVLDD